MIRLKDLLNEAKFEDVAVWPAAGAARGTTEARAKAFDIYIGNPDVIRKMAKTPMGKSGKMTSFSYDGPGGDTFKDYEWDADTSQWDVWKNMNYIILTPNNYTHWYHGKMPGGTYKDEAGNLLPGATGTSLPDLTIKGFGYKVYKALLMEPSVGYIFSDKSSSSEVKNAVYSKLMQDDDLVWIAAGGTTYDTYDDIVVINPKHANVKKVKQDFENKHKGAMFYYSRNFPNTTIYDASGIDTPGDPTM
jgi:hypothetical protein